MNKLIVILLLISLTYSYKTVVVYESLGKQKIYIDTRNSSIRTKFISVDGTATVGLDYKKKRNTRWAWKDSLRINVKILDDLLVEGDEYFYIISDNIDTTLVIIKDNDLKTDTIYIREGNSSQYIP